MDFNDTAPDAAYRAQVRGWLDTAAAEYREPPAAPWPLDEFVQRSRTWQAAKHAALASR